MGNKKETAIGSKTANGVSSTHSLLGLLESLINSGKKADASSLHIYSTSKSKSCYFEVGGKLELTAKKFSDKVLEELVDFIKTSANLERSELKLVQSATLQIDNEANLPLTYIHNPDSKDSHLILVISDSTKTTGLEDLGLWGRALEDLESVLDSGKGLIVIDSRDQYALRKFVDACLGYLKQSSRVTSVSFDSSQIPGMTPRNHDRVFTKIDSTTVNLARQVLTSNPSAIALLDPINSESLSLAIEQSQLGKIVFIATSEGSSSTSLRKVIDLSELSILLPELKLIASLSPIQTISSSNGSHPVDASTLVQLESFFGLNLPQSWRSIYSRAGIKSPEELLHLDFPLASEHGGLTSLVEVFTPTEYIKRSLLRNPDLNQEAIAMLAAQAGMISKREDGLIKALRKEVDLADVIDLTR